MLAFERLNCSHSARQTALFAKEQRTDHNSGSVGDSPTVQPQPFQSQKYELLLIFRKRLLVSAVEPHDVSEKLIPA